MFRLSCRVPRSVLLLVCTSLLAPRAGARTFPRPQPVYTDQAQPLPFERLPGDPSRLYVRVDDPALGSRLFFVDTAFTRTTCDDGLAQDLGLEPMRTARRSYGELGSVRVDKIVLPDFDLGGHRVPALACAVRDLDSTSSVASSAEQPVAGVLGANLLSRFVVVIDPHAGTLTLLDPALHGLEDGPGVVRLRREHGVGPRVRLPITVDGQQTWPLLDTGATRTHLDARRLDLPLVSERQGVARASGSSNQEPTTFRIYEIQDVDLAGHHMGPVRVIDRRKAACAPGLAGQDILGGHLLTIDSRHRRLSVQAADGGQAPAAP
jgi:hypothetical protein